MFIKIKFISIFKCTHKINNASSLCILYKHYNKLYPFPHSCQFIYAMENLPPRRLEKVGETHIMRPPTRIWWFEVIVQKCWTNFQKPFSRGVEYNICENNIFTYGPFFPRPTQFLVCGECISTLRISWMLTNFCIGT